MENYYILPVLIGDKRLHYLNLLPEEPELKKSKEILLTDNDSKVVKFLDNSLLIYYNRNGNARTIEIGNTDISLETDTNQSEFTVKI